MNGAERVSPRRSLSAVGTVLYVDGDDDARETARRELDERGVADAIETATTTDETFAVLESDAVDCIVSELDVGRGVDFLRELRSRYPNVPVIVFTDAGSERLASEAISAGVSNYLQKAIPAEFDVLAKQIDGAVTRRQIEREMARGFLAIETANEGVSLLDSNEHLIYVNEAFASMYGYEQEELIDTDWDRLDPDGVTQRIDDEIRPILEREGVWSGDIEGLRKDGSTFVASMTLSRTDDEGLVCVVHDITERKERERRLRRQKDRLDEYAGSVSHDLRNPISIARMHLELARKTGDDRHLESVADAIERLEAITSDMLDLARSDGNDAVTKRVSLSAAVADAWGDVQAEAPTLRTEVDDATIYADETLLVQLLSNLFRNAVEHGSTSSPSEAGADGTAVTVTVETTADGFAVEDNGPGIPEADRTDVFESGHTSSDGPGLGLHIVDWVVDAHDWEVTVTDGADGGARFEFGGVEFAG